MLFFLLVRHASKLKILCGNAAMCSNPPQIAMFFKNEIVCIFSAGFEWKRRAVIKEKTAINTAAIVVR